MAGRPRIPAIPCKYCGSSNTRRNGQTKAGSDRFYCYDCKKSWTENPLPHPRAGGRPISDKSLGRPKTNAEHQKAWREKNKAKKRKLKRQNKTD